MTRLLALACAVLGLLAVTAGAATAAPATNDPLLSQQWGLEQIHAPAAWARPPARGR